MNLDVINNLSVADLMALRVAVNNRVTAIETEAYTQLLEGNPVPNFKLKAGKTSRYVANTDQYEHVLNDHFGEDDIYIRKVIPLTAAEKLVKAQFDKEDGADILEQLAECYDTKTSLPSLAYDPQEA